MFIAKHGLTLLNNGYNFIPIEAGTKRNPLWMKEWQRTVASVETVRAWERDRRLKGAGIGILTRTTPAVDLDIRDQSAIEHMRNWVDENVALGAPLRIGNAPKSLLLFRATTPFRKITSRSYDDANGQKAQVEIMGDGEQIVAFGIHPDTGKEYRWVGDSPLNVARDDLPGLTPVVARQICEEFERYAQAQGWTLRKGSAGATSATFDPDDWTSTIDPGRVGLPMEELRRIVFSLPNDDLAGTQEFDPWLWTGMAIYHETEGSAEGLGLWDEWSAQSSKHNGAEVSRRWDSFSVSNKDRKPITARWLLKVSAESRREASAEKVATIKEKLGAATTEEAVREAAKLAKREEMDPVAREQLAVMVQRKLRQMLDVPLPIGMARALVRRETPNTPEMPRWLEPFVYLSGSNEFFNRVTQETFRPEAFNASFARYLLTDQQRLEGESTPEVQPADFAMNIHRIPRVDHRVYLPGQDDVFDLAGRPVVNTYNDRLVPEPPAKFTAQHREDIARVEQHFEWLFPDERERGLLLAFLAHIVQAKGRSRWAPLIIGPEGVGKTFIFVLMGGVLGSNNVRMVAASELEKEFNAFAEGSLFNCLEEVRIQGHGRFDAMNALKPLITNDFVSVRRMRTDSYMVPNCANYLLLTNHADAIPLNDSDRRYFVLDTAPGVDEVRSRDREIPGYFNNLFGAVARSPGALRRWLLDMPLHPEFNPEGRAPATGAKARLIELMEAPGVAAIRATMEENPSKPGLSRRLLSTVALQAAMEEAGWTVPETRALNAALQSMGLSMIGRVRVGGGERSRFWSDSPNDWLVGGVPDAAKIKAWMEDDL